MRGAVGDSDLRVMLAEIASSRACEMMRGSMRGLRTEDRKDLSTGVLWIRDCKITNDGTKVTFNLGGHGWQWNETTEKKAGGTFQLREYVKFAVKATIPGTLDIAYDKGDHVVSLWFSPTQSPDIQFTPVGDVDVDAKGLWSSVIGGVSSVFLGTPEQQGKQKAEKLGKQQFEHELVRGMTVAIDLCTGYQRFSMGRAPKGNLGPPDPGESRKTAVEIQPGGLMTFGPYEAPKGMHITVHSDGPVRMGLACADQVYPAAEAFIAEQDPELVDTLAQTDITGTGKLEIKPQKCKVAVVARSITNQKVTFDWQRPAREIAQSTGGPAIHCERKQTVSSDGDGGDRPAGRAAARRR
ncbi:MAG TPA: hypothetical protein VIV11_39620 [Kofleriaceae bacterium]